MDSRRLQLQIRRKDSKGRNGRVLGGEIKGIVVEAAGAGGWRWGRVLVLGDG